MIPLKKIGFVATMLYGVMFYVPQFLLHITDPDIFDERFDRFDALPYAFLIPVFFIIFFALRYIPIERPVHAFFKHFRLEALFESKMIVLPIALLHLVASYKIFRDYGIGIRFNEQGLRGEGPLVAIAFFTGSYARIWIFYHFLRIINGATVSSKEVRLYATIFATGMTLGLNSSSAILDILAIALLIFLQPKKIRSFLVKEKSHGSTAKIKLRTVLLWMLLPVALLSVIYFGYVNKLGVEGVNRLTQRVGIMGVVSMTVERMSTSYFSVIAFATKHLTDVPFYETIYAIPWNRFWYRLSLILTPTMALDRPDILNINRLNLITYLNPGNAYNLGVVGGASPGLVASGFYLAPFPLGFVFMALFSLFFVRMLNSAMHDEDGRGTILLPLFLLPYLVAVYDSPMDLLAIDPSFMFAILLTFVLIAARRQKESMAAQEVEKSSPLFVPRELPAT